MNEQVTYGSWFQGKTKMVELYTPDEARKLFDQGKEFDVVFGPLDRPTCYMTVRMEKGDEYIAAGFLDHMIREIGSVIFGKRTSTRGAPEMFAGQYDKRRYLTDDAPDGRGFYDHTLYLTSADGSVQIRYESIEPGSLTIGQSVGNDVSDHWEPMPVFGDWTRFVRTDRRLAMPPMPENAKKWPEIKVELEKAQQEEDAARKAATLAKRRATLAKKANSSKPGTKNK